MNELPVIGSLCAKNFWDRHGANIASCWKEMWGERLFRRSKKRFWREINAFSPQFYYKWILLALTLNML